MTCPTCHAPALSAGPTGMEPARPARHVTPRACRPDRARDLGPGASVAAVLDERARAAAEGAWVPANGGAETVTTYRTGRRLLYCWQPTTGRHAYLDADTDLILSDDEAMQAIGL